jgi:hypothetical protein
MTDTQMPADSIKVNVSLYGSLARLGGGRHVAQMDVILPRGATKSDLLAKLGVSVEERSYLFINAVLCDMPGLVTGVEEVLEDNDHVGIFSVGHMWPYQYRDGIRMSPGLQKALKEKGAMHHTYEVKASTG